MSSDITILMAIAVIQAIVIGILLSDKLGLINKTEIKDNPSYNKHDAYNPKDPSR